MRGEKINKFTVSFKKTLAMLMVLIMMFSLFGSSLAFAASNTDSNPDPVVTESSSNIIVEPKSPIDTVVRLDKETSDLTEIQDDENSIFGIGFRVIKPIRSQGKIDNRNLLEYIRKIENGVNTVTLIGWLGSVLNPLTGTVAGGVITLASYLHNKYGSGRLDTLREAYYRGDHLYLVITSATFDGTGAGVEKIEVFSNLNMHFYYDPIN